jgi:hypothetical protein
VTRIRQTRDAGRQSENHLRRLTRIPVTTSKLSINDDKLSGRTIRLSWREGHYLTGVAAMLVKLACPAWRVEANTHIAVEGHVDRCRPDPSGRLLVEICKTLASWVLYSC